MAFLSKTIERVVAKQLQPHFDSSGLHNIFQSAYKANHSTETALLRFQNDILMAIDGGLTVVVVFLDLSAAFDTICHQILLSRLEHRFGIKGQVLSWIKSYLQDRVQSVHIGKVASTEKPLNCGVPQGSVLGPILFTAYTAPLTDIIQQHGLHFHCYADDIQLYVALPSKKQDDTILALNGCLADIRNWMESNFLKLNDSKTESIVFGSQSKLTI